MLQQLPLISSQMWEELRGIDANYKFLMWEEIIKVCACGLLHGWFMGDKECGQKGGWMENWLVLIASCQWRWFGLGAAFLISDYVWYNARKFRKVKSAKMENPFSIPLKITAHIACEVLVATLWTEEAGCSDWRLHHQWPQNTFTWCDCTIYFERMMLMIFMSTKHP